MPRVRERLGVTGDSGPLVPSEDEPMQDSARLGETIAEGPPPQPIADDYDRGTTLGRYVVLEPVGRGGMGVVYAAYDPKLDRRVALKVLHRRYTRGHGDEGREGPARLLREAQAMARLSHPNVIAVHDVGTLEQRVFIAMEFVQGQTLGHWLEARRRSWRRIVDAFVRAGQGLVAAHTAGLIHRDFKPDNVMVGGSANEGGMVVRVMDFGLARPAYTDAHEDTGDSSQGDSAEDPLATPLTKAGAVMGTPAYMAPEQHFGEAVDARTDQFSFCVALYEALYGERPYRGETVAALQFQLEHGEIRDAPRDTDVPTWLRKVVLRGLVRDPTRRWPDMAALLAQLDRDPSSSTRRWVSWAGALGIVFGVVGIAAQLQTRRASVCEGADAAIAEVWNDDRRARVAAALADGGTYGEELWARLGPRLDEYAATWATDHRDACEATRLREEQSEELLDLRMACLHQRRADLRAVVEVLEQSDPKVMRRATETVDSLRDLSTCRDRAALISAPLLPGDPAVAAEVAAAREVLARARALQAAGRYADAESTAREVLAGSAAASFLAVRAEARAQVAAALERLGRFDEALATSRDALWDAMEAGHDRLVATVAIHIVGVMAHRLARHDEAAPWIRLATAAVGRVDRGGPVEARWLYTQGLIHQDKGEFGIARDALTRSLAIHDALSGRTTLAASSVLDALGNCELTEGNFDEAVRDFGRALQASVAEAGARHPRTALYRNNLGNALFEKGQYDAALNEYRQSLEINREAFGDDHPAVAMGIGNVANVMQRTGRVLEALEHYDRARATYEKVFGPDHPAVAVSLVNRGGALALVDRLEEAEQALTRALGILEKTAGPSHPDVASCLDSLGSIVAKRGRHADALPHHRRALEIWEAVAGPQSPLLASALTHIAQAELAIDHPDEAVAAAERAVALVASEQVEAETKAAAFFVLARSLWATEDRPPRAVSMAIGARRQFESLGPGAQSQVAAVDAWLRQNG